VVDKLRTLLKQLALKRYRRRGAAIGALAQARDVVKQAVTPGGGG